VTVDEPTLDADPTPLSDRADELADRVERLFLAGARHVAVDFLLPERWSRSEAFSRFVMRRQHQLTLAAYVSARGETVGPECLGGLTVAALGPDGLGRLFGLVNVDEDKDGVTRRTRLAYRDRQGGRHESWALHAGSSLETAPRADEPGTVLWLDAAADTAAFLHVSWKDLPQRLAEDPDLVRGRLVLVGGEYAASGDDHHRVTASSPAVSGLVLHALVIHSLLDPHPVRGAPAAAVGALTCAMAAILLSGALLLAGRSAVALLAGVVFLLQIAVALLLFRWSRVLLPLAAPGLAVLLTLGAGFLLRLRLPCAPSAPR
jgi:CHASE2 domain-containing sensor protein